MTWSKIATSSIQVDPAEFYYAAKKYEQYEEVLGWFTNRGWTVTPWSQNNVTNSAATRYRLEKQMTSYEGQPFTVRYNLHHDISPAGTCILISPAYALESTPGGGFNTIRELPSDLFPQDTATGIELWQSDLDTDSMLIFAKSLSGHTKLAGWVPGSNSIRHSKFVNNISNYAQQQLSFLPLCDGPTLINGNTIREAGFGEVSHSNSSNYDDTVPVVTKGELTIHDEATLFVKWRQADVATLEDLSNAIREFEAANIAHVGTALIDGDYYIRLGNPLGSSVALFNCGSVNPNFNI